MAKVSAAPDLSQIERLLDNIERSGESFGEMATTLSDIIDDTEARLLEAPGKVSACVEGDGIKVGFSREQNNWSLWVSDNESGSGAAFDAGRDPLTSVSVVRKARAFPLFLRLLLEIERAQQDQLQQVTAALSLLKSGGK